MKLYILFFRRELSDEPDTFHQVFTNSQTADVECSRLNKKLQESFLGEYDRYIVQETTAII